MENESKELMAIEQPDLTNGDLTHLNPLLDQDMIIRLGDNLMGVHPEAKAIGKPGMRTVAQLALVTGANPLPGTNGIHAWIDHKGKLCIQFGMGFWRGKAEEAGGLIWKDRPRPMSDQEKVQWGIGEGEVGFICKGTTWDAVKRLRRDEKEMGGELSWKDAVEILYKEGVGVVSEDTYNYKDKTGYKEQKQGRALYWTASERAERDLLRKLVPIFQPGRNVHEWKGNQPALTAPGAVKLATGPEWGAEEDFNGHNVDEINSDIYAGQEPIEAEFEETAETPPQPGPMDWHPRALAAETLDDFSAVVYQQWRDWFPDATKAKKGIVYVCGDNWQTVDKTHALDAIDKYVNALADGATQRKAADAAKRYYENEVALEAEYQHGLAAE